MDNLLTIEVLSRSEQTNERTNLFRNHGSTLVSPAHAMASSAWRSPYSGSFRSELCLALASVHQPKSRGERLAHDPPGHLLPTYLPYRWIAHGLPMDCPCKSMGIHGYPWVIVGCRLYPSSHNILLWNQQNQIGLPTRCLTTDA